MGSRNRNFSLMFGACPQELVQLKDKSRLVYESAGQKQLPGTLWLLQNIKRNVRDYKLWHNTYYREANTIYVLIHNHDISRTYGFTKGFPMCLHSFSYWCDKQFGRVLQYKTFLLTSVQIFYEILPFSGWEWSLKIPQDGGIFWMSK